MRLPFTHTPKWVLAALLSGGIGAALAGEAEEQRVFFDPTRLGSATEVLGRTAKPAVLAAHPPLPRPNPAKTVKKTAAAPSRLNEPASHQPRAVALGLPRSKVADEDSRAGSRAFDGFKVGTFSIGVETETNYKQRSPSGEEVSAATYETPHPGLVVPFIGLSAKSALH